MKKIFSLILVCLILILSFPVVSAAENPWEAAYRKILAEDADPRALLIDTNGDRTPELVTDTSSGVRFYYMKGSSAQKAYEGTTIPFEFFCALKSMSSVSKKDSFFFGQSLYEDKIYTYRIDFQKFVPSLDILAEEEVATGLGNIKLDKEVFSQSSNVTEEVSSFFSDYVENYTISAEIITDEIKAFEYSGAVNRAFGRYNLFAEMTDNQVSFSVSQREKIKKTAGTKSFNSFRRICVLSDEYIFAEFYVNDTKNQHVILPYQKRYVLLNGELDVIQSYPGEKYIDAVKIFPLIAVENAPANIIPDYEKTKTFRGIDDYVNYLSQSMPQDLVINANGKKNLAQFMEYAVNKCSRAELKAKDNTLTVDKKAVSIIAQNASISMGQLVSLCKSKNISQIRAARTIPELVCTGLDFSRPIRIEFTDGTYSALSRVTGIRLMLDDSRGIYLNTAELALLEENTDTFCIEYSIKEDVYSITFTDSKSQKLSEIFSPVWFVVPAKYEYSSVLASFGDKIENRGGKFDPRNGTIEFSAVHSGKYHVVEDDVTINDTDSLPISKSEAIRFLVSKGILDLDEENNFHPEDYMTLFEFDSALHNMFYDSPCQTDSLKLRLTKESMLASCGKILVEKKGYQCPDDYMEFLLFADKTSLVEENIPYIAVAVQCGLTENSGQFLPETFVTRAYAAEILYKTYMLLYDSSMVTTSISSAVQNTTEPIKSDISIMGRLGLCAGITLIIALVVAIVSKKKKDDNEN